MIDESPCLTWNFSDCSVADSATATQQLLCRRFHQCAHCVCRCPDACPLFRTSLAAFSSYNLYPKKTVLTTECCNLDIHTEFRSKFCLLYWPASKFANFAWYSVKISVIFDVWFERRKDNKKAQLTLSSPRDVKACKNCSNSTCFVSFHRIPFPRISKFRPRPIHTQFEIWCLPIIKFLVQITST